MFKTTCDHDGCDANRERGFVYCAEHLSVEVNRWLDESEADANLSL